MPNPVIARSSCDEAIQTFFGASGLLRFARNDGAEVAQRLFMTGVGIRRHDPGYGVAAFTIFIAGGLAPTGVPNTRSKPAR